MDLQLRLEKARNYATELSAQLLSRDPVALSDLPPHDQRFYHRVSRIVALNFAQDTTEAILSQLFSPFGYVQEIELPRDSTNELIGAATITFDAPEAVVLVTSELSGRTIGGKELRIGQPNGFPQQTPPNWDVDDGSRLYISNISFCATETELFDRFSVISGFETLSLIPDFKRGGHKGYGYVKFDIVNSAQIAMHVLKNYSIAGQPIKLIPTIYKFKMPPRMAFMDVPQLPREQAMEASNATETIEDMEKTTILRLRDMIGQEEDLSDPDLEVDIREECEKFGKIVEVKFYKHEQLSSRAGCADVFLKYENPEDVGKAISVLDGRFFAGQKIIAERFSMIKYKENNLQ